jgi:hypothetical protein
VDLRYKLLILHRSMAMLRPDERARRRSSFVVATCSTFAWLKRVAAFIERRTPVWTGE